GGAHEPGCEGDARGMVRVSGVEGEAKTGFELRKWLHRLANPRPFLQGTAPPHLRSRPRPDRTYGGGGRRIHHAYGGGTKSLDGISGIRAWLRRILDRLAGRPGLGAAGPRRPDPAPRPLAGSGRRPGGGPGRPPRRPPASRPSATLGPG